MYLAQDRNQWRAPVNTVSELSGSIKGGEFRDWLNDYQLLKDSVPWRYSQNLPY